MDTQNSELACGLVNRTYISQGSEALTRRRRLVKALLSQRKLPPVGWDDATIEMLVQDAALMDSNNFLDNVGVGEREARVVCELVARRHYRLAHGVGRSGDVAAEQPKAAGSSLLARLTNLLAADALEIAGLREVGPVLVLPLATGMAITATLLALRGMRPHTARYVLWPRVDQKTCLKSITAAGYEVVVVPPRRSGDQLMTDTDALAAHVAALGADAVAAVVTTTSCFAPRAADDVVAVAKLCAGAGVPHVINNAYGVQAAALCAAVSAAWRRGRVDAVVQSTDKNFMVPVGGAIIAARRGATQLVEAVNKLYPGRASMSPLLDLLITLLHWGAAGWRCVLAQREALHVHARARLQQWAAQHGERVLDTPGNPISLAITLSSLGGEAEGGSDWGDAAAGGAQADALPESCSAAGSNEQADEAGQEQGEQREMAEQQEPPQTQGGAGTPPPAPLRQQHQQQQQHRPSATFLGSMLFRRCVSGTRVVARGRRQEVGGHVFEGYGAHTDDYPCDYLTVAAALGTSEADIETFLARLSAALGEFRRRQQGGG
eukprot:scaffold8.g1435.t1